MRRTHLRHHENILKRLLVHVAGFNLGILMRDLLGTGTPREFAGLRGALGRLLLCLLRAVTAFWNGIAWSFATFVNFAHQLWVAVVYILAGPEIDPTAS
jgi:transposase